MIKGADVIEMFLHKWKNFPLIPGYLVFSEIFKVENSAGNSKTGHRIFFSC